MVCRRWLKMVRMVEDVCCRWACVLEYHQTAVGRGGAGGISG